MLESATEVQISWLGMMRKSRKWDATNSMREAFVRESSSSLSSFLSGMPSSPDGNENGIDATGKRFDITVDLGGELDEILG